MEDILTGGVPVHVTKTLIHSKKTEQLEPKESEMKKFAARYPKVMDTAAMGMFGAMFGATMYWLYNLPIG